MISLETVRWISLKKKQDDLVRSQQALSIAERERKHTVLLNNALALSFCYTKRPTSKGGQIFLNVATFFCSLWTDHPFQASYGEVSSRELEPTCGQVYPDVRRLRAAIAHAEQNRGATAQGAFLSRADAYPFVPQQPWTPFVLCEPDPRGEHIKLYRNSRYQVHVRRYAARDGGADLIHFSVKRLDGWPYVIYRERM